MIFRHRRDGFYSFELSIMLWLFRDARHHLDDWVQKLLICLRVLWQSHLHAFKIETSRTFLSSARLNLQLVGSEVSLQQQYCSDGRNVTKSFKITVNHFVLIWFTLVKVFGWASINLLADGSDDKSAETFLICLIVFWLIRRLIRRWFGSKI